MQPSLREDYLEAILIYTKRYFHHPSAPDLSNELHIDEADVHAHLYELVQQGDITLEENGGITLTDQGAATGKQIIKKHETLQCFLSEILGMDTSSASDEACKIEHAVSDETINLLGSYLRAPVQGDRRHNSCGYAKSLVDFNEGERLVVRDILGRNCSKRLLDLGVVPGQEILIKRKLGNQSVVVQVKDCDVALSPEIASAICVEKIP